MAHSRMIPLAEGRTLSRLSMLDNTTQRYLMDARVERQQKVPLVLLHALIKGG